MVTFNLYGRSWSRLSPPTAFGDEVNMAEDEIKEINLVGFDVFYNFPLDGSEQVIITQLPEHGNLGDVTLISEQVESSGESEGGDWITAYTMGSFTDCSNCESGCESHNGQNACFDLSEDEFNSVFQESEDHIIRRLCTNCAPSHQEIYYKRVTDPTNFEPRNYMLNTWQNSPWNGNGTTNQYCDS